MPHRPQVQLAYRCALLLRDVIHPYILRRVKADVKFHLPEKSEQILFCRLSAHQRQEYRRYLNSKDVRAALASGSGGGGFGFGGGGGGGSGFGGNANGGRSGALRAIDSLLKLCNHPDLLERTSAERPADYGAAERSAKLQVVGAVLRAWKRDGHRVLLFAQTRQMLDILEAFVVAEGHAHLRLDGNTPIRARQPMIDDFNTNADVFVFCLTTKAGGLGVNLIGADRVLLYGIFLRLFCRYSTIHWVLVEISCRSLKLEFYLN